MIYTTAYIGQYIFILHDAYQYEDEREQAHPMPYLWS